MFPVIVRYHPAPGVVLSVLGVFVMIGGFALANVLSLLLGAFNFAIGIAFAVRPWFVLHADHLVVLNLFGMTLRRYEFASVAELSIEGRRVYRRGPDGTRERLRFVGGRLVRPEDWARLERALAAGPDGPDPGA